MTCVEITSTALLSTHEAIGVVDNWQTNRTDVNVTILSEDPPPKRRVCWAWMA
jgi:hypothetical protein